MAEIENFILRKGQKLTQEQEERLNALSEMNDDEIIFDDDCPELTEEQLSRMTRRNAKISKTA